MRAISTICGGVALLGLFLASHPAAGEAPRVEAPAVIEFKSGSFGYWAAGEFTRAGKPVDAPRRIVQISTSFSIMERQVTAGEYGQCVAEKACAPLPYEAVEPDLPAVMVNFNDATAYAAWLSKKIGEHYRLPTDEEWTYAAGSRAPAETPLGDADAIARWLERYNRESQSQPKDLQPQPIGHFGANDRGLLDVGGNVWEWTTTCYTRTVLDAAGEAVGRGTRNCGVRVTEGRHRAYVIDFIRDPRAGGCAAGIPPSNLGFRLVRENKSTWTLF